MQPHMWLHAFYPAGEPKDARQALRHPPDPFLSVPLCPGVLDHLPQGLLAPVNLHRHVLLALDLYRSLAHEQLHRGEPVLGVFIDPMSDAQQGFPELLGQLDRAATGWVEFLDNSHPTDVLD